MAEHEPLKCCNCPVVQAPGIPFFFCDKSPQNGQEGPWCGECFDDIPCGKGQHDEGCETMMLDDQS